MKYLIYFLFMTAGLLSAQSNLVYNEAKIVNINNIITVPPGKTWKIMSGDTNNNINIKIDGVLMGNIGPNRVLWAHAGSTITTSGGTNTSRNINVIEFNLVPVGTSVGSNSGTPTFNLSQANSISGGNPNNIPVAYASPLTYAKRGTYTWMVPPGITTVCVDIWGAGGYTTNSQTTGGGAGGFGHECVMVTPLETLTIQVGSGLYNRLVGQGKSYIANSNGTILVEATAGQPDGTGGSSTAALNYPGRPVTGTNGGSATYGGQGGSYYGCNSNNIGENGSTPGGGASRTPPSCNQSRSGGDGTIIIYLE